MFSKDVISIPPPLFSRGFSPLREAAPIPFKVPLQHTIAGLVQKKILAAAPIAQGQAPLAEKITQLNANFSWTFAKVHALFNAIYQDGIADEAQDGNAITNFSKDIEELEKSLSAINLSDTEIVGAHETIGQAKQAIAEMAQLVEELQKFYPVQEELAEALGRITDSYLNPLFPGESLLVTEDVKKSMENIAELQQQIASLPDKSAARMRLESLASEEIRQVEFALEDWGENILQVIKQEHHYLENEPNLSKDANLLRQLTALKAQQEDIIRQLESFYPPLKIRLCGQFYKVQRKLYPKS